MKQYCLKNDVCRRKILGSYYDTEYDGVLVCAWCDVCLTITCLSILVLVSVLLPHVNL